MPPSQTKLVSRLSQACLTARETGLLLYIQGLSSPYYRKFASFCAIHFLCFDKKLIRVNTRVNEFEPQNKRETTSASPTCSLCVPGDRHRRERSHPSRKDRKRRQDSELGQTDGTRPLGSVYLDCNLSNNNRSRKLRG